MFQSYTYHYCIRIRRTKNKTLLFIFPMKTRVYETKSEPSYSTQEPVSIEATMPLSAVTES